MPGVSRDTTTAATSTSLVESGPSSASMMAWVPHSTKPTNRAPGVDNDANGSATRRNNTSIGSAPNLTRAWNNPELDGNTYFSRQRDTHDNPLTSCAKTSS